MNCLPTFVRRFFRPVVLMDTTPDVLDRDPIGAELDAAVGEHERVGQVERETYQDRLGATIDDLLRKLGRPPERNDRSDG